MIEVLATKFHQYLIENNYTTQPFPIFSIDDENIKSELQESAIYFEITWSDRTENAYGIIFPQLKALSSHLRQFLQTKIEILIRSDPSHLVCGVYTYFNLFDRPENTMIFFISPEDGRIHTILNYFPKDQININISPELSSFELEILNRIIRSENNKFIFISGQHHLSSVIKNIPYSNISRNNVYHLQSFQIEPDLPPLNEKAEYSLQIFTEPNYSTEFTKLNPIQLQYLEVLNNHYHYNKSPEEMLELIKDLPHVGLFLKDEIIAGARANIFADKFSIIGGVFTQPLHRRKGFGFLVCYELVKYLYSNSEIIALETDEDNFPADNIYRRLGFQKQGKSVFLDIGTNIIKEIFGNRDY